jgi:cobalt-zinc-cadmium efflux system protein
VTRTTRLLVALGVNAALVVVQLVAGIGAHSTGLVSDAGHNLTDVAAIGLSLLAVRWALRPRSDARSFGNHRATILAALVNSAALAAVTVAVVVLSLERLVHPRPVDGTTMTVVAGVALAVNLLAALVLWDRTQDLNMRGAVLHMAADAAASACVLVAGVAIVVGGPAWDRADPISALVVAALIVTEALRLTRASVDVLLESTPADLSLSELRRVITDTPGVAEVHDLHVWSLSSEVRALSAHLVLTGHPSLEEAQVVGGRVRTQVEGPFDLAHTTFELECERCADDPDDPCRMDELAADPAAPPAGHGDRGHRPSVL